MVVDQHGSQVLNADSIARSHMAYLSNRLSCGQGRRVVQTSCGPSIVSLVNG
jgi:hypothetical protein